MAVRFPQDRSCGRKRRFETWNAAARAARRINHEHDETLSAVYCRFCTGFHLAHTPKARLHHRPHDEE